MRIVAAKKQHDVSAGSPRAAEVLADEAHLSVRDRCEIWHHRPFELSARPIAIVLQNDVQRGVADEDALKNFLDFGVPLVQASIRAAC